MRCKRARTAVVLMLVFSFDLPLLAEDVDGAQATALLTRAAQKANLYGPSGLPFRARFRLRAFGARKVLEGTYTVFWLSENRSRIEAVLSSFSRVVVRRDGSIWTSSSLDFTPLPIHELGWFIDPGVLLGLGTNEAVDKVTERKVADRLAVCVEVGVKQRPRRELCLDPVEDSLVSAVHGYHRAEYFNYVRFGDKVVPSKIQIHDADRLIVEASLDVIAALDSPDRELFEPPEGAIQTSASSCRAPSQVSEGKVRAQKHPDYPVQARIKREQGRVTILAVIGKDGSVTKAVVVRTAGQSFDKAALDAVRTWRFEPFSCNGEPVEYETTINVNFGFPR